MSEFLTTGETAALLGVSKPTVVRAIQRGMLRPALVTPGQHRRFRREDVMAFRARIHGQVEPVEVPLTGRAASSVLSRAAIESVPSPIVSVR